MYRLIFRSDMMLSGFICGCKKWLYRESGIQAEGDDENRFRREAIHESGAKNSV